MKKQYIQPKCSIVALAGDIIATSDFGINSASLHDLNGYSGGYYSSAAEAEADGITVLW